MLLKKNYYVIKIATMIKYPINPEYCLILNAFSHSGSLRGAADLLGIDPPSLVRKVRRLVAETDFLHKTNNRWVLSESGQKIAQWTEGIINEQKTLKEDKPRIRIGAFPWLAEEMLIPQFSQLLKKTDQKNSWSFQIVAKDLEKELIQSRVDFIVTGHAPNNPSIAHKKSSTYPWVAICPKDWKKKFDSLPEKELSTALKELPYIRHSEINPERYMDFKPEQTFNCTMDGVIGVRSAVVAGFGWSIVPVMSAQTLIREKKIFKLDVHTKIKDEFSLWWLRDRKDLRANSKIIFDWLNNFKIN